METQRSRKNAGVFAGGGGGEAVPLFLDTVKKRGTCCVLGVFLSQVTKHQCVLLSGVAFIPLLLNHPSPRSLPSQAGHIKDREGEQLSGGL